MLGGVKGHGTAKDSGKKSQSGGREDEGQKQLMARWNPLETLSRREGASCSSLIRKDPVQPSPRGRGGNEYSACPRGRGGGLAGVS